MFFKIVSREIVEYFLPTYTTVGEKMARKIRYGIIGFGGFAERSIAPAIQASPNSEFVALQKRSLAAAGEKARLFHVPLAFDSAEKLANHPEVEAVFITSAVVRHAQDTFTAAMAGKHILVEKPMAMNAAEAGEMIEACRSRNVKLMIGQMVRLSPLIVRMRELIRSGEIGTPTFVKTEYVYDARLSKRQWLKNRKIAGGGVAFDIGVHCLDTIRYLLDDEVVSVKSQLAPPPTETETEQTCLLSLKFAQGIPASIFCSFISSYRRALIEVIGQEGTLSAENFPFSDVTIPLKVVLGKNGAPAETRVEDIVVPNLYESEVSLFSESILNNTPLPVPGEEGLKNQLVLDEAMKG
ncbi:MAG: gfo/Idh/MocA family oxidoreductase [Ignavibacteriae bacterium]|nr:MAG: gfo/Idh/MocA family oxidoreductase [Ignavibacteriota bacterium]